HLVEHSGITVVERVVAHLHERQQVRCSAAGLGRSTHASVHWPRTLITRFFTVLPSGTLRNIQRGRRPGGSCSPIEADSSFAPSSTGRSSTSAQKRASSAAWVQSKVTAYRVVLIGLPFVVPSGVFRHAV